MINACSSCKTKKGTWLAFLQLLIICTWIKLPESIINTSIQATLGDKPHPAICKWNFEIKPFLKDTKGKKPFQANSFKWILYIEIFSVISVEFGAVIEPSISPTSDADEHFNITNKYTFEMQDLSYKHKSLSVCSSGALYVRCRWLCRDRC